MSVAPAVSNSAISAKRCFRSHRNPSAISRLRRRLAARFWLPPVWLRPMNVKAPAVKANETTSAKKGRICQFREDREALLDGGQGHQPDN